MSNDWFIDGPSGRKLVERKAVIYTLPKASGKTLEKARRTWPEAQLSDFEREGKDWIDKATGVHHRRVPGDPMLGGANKEDVATFSVEDGHVVYLLRAGDPGHVLSTEVGEMGSRQATPMDFVQAYTEAGPR